VSQRQPWWYSGEEATAALDDPVPPASEAADSAPDPDGPVDDGGPEPRVDVSALAQGAQRLIEWATERVVAPHAEHGEPAEHPDCLMCRAALLLGPAGPGPSGAGAPERRTPVEPITWFSVLDGRSASRRHP
jgi:hypothetical protein